MTAPVVIWTEGRSASVGTCSLGPGRRAVELRVWAGPGGTWPWQVHWHDGGASIDGGCCVDDSRDAAKSRAEAAARRLLRPEPRPPAAAAPRPKSLPLDL